MNAKMYTLGLTVAFTGYMFMTRSQTKTEMLPTQEEMNAYAQKNVTTVGESPLVDFDAYADLVAIVRDHRKTHLITLVQFSEMSKEKNTIILDTRSDEMYKSKHVKGAIHLNFSDFTQQTLARIIPNTNTRVLIYCNNNFDKDQENFASKMVMPKPIKLDVSTSGKPQSTNEEVKDKPLTLALNIPTYINLYGYGYKNVYELSELISVFNPRVQFEGTSVE